MHASNLLKTVLKPRTPTSSSSGQSLNTKNEAKSRAARSSSPDTALASLSVTKKSTPVPVKMSCLCAPTNHAGSFRCRLHRGTQQSWGGRPLTPAPSPTGKPSSAGSDNDQSVTPVAVENGTVKRISHLLPSARPSPMSFLPPVHLHRSTDARPSRLSKVSVATEVEAPVSQARVSTPTPKDGNNIVRNNTVRYLKFTGGAGCASGAVLEGGMVFIKKLQSGGKDVMLDVFGSGTGLSRAGLSL